MKKKWLKRFLFAFQVFWNLTCQIPVSTYNFTFALCGRLTFKRKMASARRHLALFICFVQFIVCLLASNLTATSQARKRPLYIGSMAPMTGKKAWWGAGIPLAIEMAFEDINARNDILKEYRLQLVARDTQVRYRTCLFKHWIALYPPDKSLSSG